MWKEETRGEEKAGGGWGVGGRGGRQLDWNLQWGDGGRGWFLQGQLLTWLSCHSPPTSVAWNLSEVSGRTPLPAENAVGKPGPALGHNGTRKRTAQISPQVLTTADRRSPQTHCQPEHGPA